MKRAIIVPRRIWFLIEAAVVVVTLGASLWAASVFGGVGFFVGGFVAAIALVLLLWPLRLTPETENDINEDDWRTFFKVLFWRVIPCAVGVWLLQQWSMWLETGH